MLRATFEVPIASSTRVEQMPALHRENEALDKNRSGQNKCSRDDSSPRGAMSARSDRGRNPWPRALFLLAHVVVVAFSGKPVAAGGTASVASAAAPCPVGQHAVFHSANLTTSAPAGWRCAPCPAGRHWVAPPDFAAAVAALRAKVFPGPRGGGLVHRARCDFCAPGRHMDGIAAARAAGRAASAASVRRRRTRPMTRGGGHTYRPRVWHGGTTWPNAGITTTAAPRGGGAEDAVETVAAVRAAADCEKCPLGRHSRGPGALLCKMCPAGRFQSQPGHSVCAACPEGKFRLAGLALQSSYLASSCKTCSAGTWSDPGAAAVAAAAAAAAVLLPGEGGGGGGGGGGAGDDAMSMRRQQQRVREVGPTSYWRAQLYRTQRGRGTLRAQLRSLRAVGRSIAAAEQALAQESRAALAAITAAAAAGSKPGGAATAPSSAALASSLARARTAGDAGKRRAAGNVAAIAVVAARLAAANLQSAAQRAALRESEAWDAVRAAVGCMPCAAGRHSAANAGRCMRCDRDVGNEGGAAAREKRVAAGDRSDSSSGSSDSDGGKVRPNDGFGGIGRPECQLWDGEMATPSPSAAAVSPSSSELGFVVLDTAGMALPSQKEGVVPLSADMYLVSDLAELAGVSPGDGYSSATEEQGGSEGGAASQKKSTARKLPVHLKLHGQISMSESTKRSIKVRLAPVPAPHKRKHGYDHHKKHHKHGKHGRKHGRKHHKKHHKRKKPKMALPTLFGMSPPARDWILYGPYADKSMVRNMLTYGLSNAAGLRAPRTRMVELLIVGGGGGVVGADAAVDASDAVRATEASNGYGGAGDELANAWSSNAETATRAASEGASAGLGGGGGGGAGRKREGGGREGAELWEVAAWGPRLQKAREARVVAEKAIWSAVNASRALAPALHAMDVNATALRLQLKQLSIRAQAARAEEARARWWLRRGYRGVYVLVEQIRQNSEVDSAERRDGASCKGGGAGRADCVPPIVPVGAAFVLRTDKVDESDPFMTTSVTGMRVLPNVFPHHVSHAQAEEARRLLDAFEARLFGREPLAARRAAAAAARLGGSDNVRICSGAGAGGALELIDRRSFIDYFLLQELARNVDGFRWSTYFSMATPASLAAAGLHPPRNAGAAPPMRISMGPLWDFNIAFGNAMHLGGDEPNGNWLYQTYVSREYNQLPTKHVAFWYQRLFELEGGVLAEEVAERWEVLRGRSEGGMGHGQWSDAGLAGMIVELVRGGGHGTSGLGSQGFGGKHVYGGSGTSSGSTSSGGMAPSARALQRNFLRWPMLNRRVWPNPEVGGSYGLEVAYLTRFTLARAHWMDEAVGKLRWSNNAARLPLRFRFTNLRLLGKQRGLEDEEDEAGAKVEEQNEQIAKCVCPRKFQPVHVPQQKQQEEKENGGNGQGSATASTPSSAGGQLSAAYFNLPKADSVTDDPHKPVRDDDRDDDDSGTGGGKPHWGGWRERGLLLRDPAFVVHGGHAGALLWRNDADNRKVTGAAAAGAEPQRTPLSCPAKPRDASSRAAAIHRLATHWPFAAAARGHKQAKLYSVLREVEPPGSGWLGDSIRPGGGSSPPLNSSGATCWSALSRHPSAHVTASKDNPPREIAVRLFDGLISSKWLAQAQTLVPGVAASSGAPPKSASAMAALHREEAVAWVAIRFDAVAARQHQTAYPHVSAYTITTAEDFVGRDPAAWALQGWLPHTPAPSDDAAAAANRTKGATQPDGEGTGCWVTLDERSGERFTGRDQTRRFCVDTEAAGAHQFPAFRLLVRRLHLVRHYYRCRVLRPPPPRVLPLTSRSAASFLCCWILCASAVNRWRSAVHWLGFGGLRRCS